MDTVEILLEITTLYGQLKRVRHEINSIFDAVDKLKCKIYDELDE